MSTPHVRPSSLSISLKKPSSSNSYTDSRPTTPSILLPPRQFLAPSPSITPPELSSPPTFSPIFHTSSPSTPTPFSHPEIISSLIDLPSRPISDLLKDGTRAAHRYAEHSDGAKALIAGTLSEEEYLRYLVILWLMYRGLEEALDRVVRQEGSMDVKEGDKQERGKERKTEAVEGIWKRRRLLSRTRGLESDINFFISRITLSNPSDPQFYPSNLPTSTSFPIPFTPPQYLHSLLISPPQAIQSYTSRLEHLSHHDPSRLLAHAYVRYLGDLSGGQMVAVRIKRSYALGSGNVGNTSSADGSSSSHRKEDPFPMGTKFYEFDFDDTQKSTQQSTGQDRGEGSEWEGERNSLKEQIEEVKGWFRETMDLGIGDDEDLKVAIVDEAITAFQLSTSLFSLLSGPPSPLQDSSNTSSTTMKTTSTTSVSPKQTVQLFSPSSTVILYGLVLVAPILIAIIYSMMERSAQPGVGLRSGLSQDWNVLCEIVHGWGNELEGSIWKGWKQDGG